MQNWWKKVICAGLVGVSVLTANYAEAGVPNKFPLQCYASKQVTTYSSINGSRWGYISANADLIQITQINGDWAYGSYPTSKGRISRWFRLSDIVPNLSFSHYETGMYRASKAYRTESSGTVLGTVYVNDKVTVVYRGSSRSQVIYPVSGGYKMGWVNNGDIKTVTQPAQNNGQVIKGDINGDGRIDDNDVALLVDAYFGDIVLEGNRKKAADMNDDGRINLSDVSLLKLKLQAPTRPSKPSNFSITTNKTTYNVGETIQFNFSSTGADELYIPIDINGKREHFINVTGRTSYSMQASTSGTYSYTLYGRNKNGEYNIEYKSFSVNGISWDALVNRQLANLNSDNYKKPVNSFNQSYISSDGKKHQYNCTWYAWGRMREVTGKSIEFNGGRNAKQWRDNTTNCNHVSLQDKCVAVTQQGGGGNGHVGNEYVYYTEANVNDSTDLKVRKAQINTFLSKYTTFLK